MAEIVTRFAPSPTGLLHLGHAHAALFAAEQAKRAGGRFLLRIEDIDQGRCRREYEDAIFEDLAWLGLDWENPVRRQSDFMADYEAALDRLGRLGVLYPCFCTRKDIAAEIEAAQGAPHMTRGAPHMARGAPHMARGAPHMARGAPHMAQNGPDGPLYPGTCRRLSAMEREAKAEAGVPFALRLDMARAREIAGPLMWHDVDAGQITATPEIFGDVVLARKDTPTSYHLSVTLDDHIQGVSLVTRGEDLFAATHIHRLLQHLLDLEVPTWRHHGLLLGPDGKRLAKRDKAQTLRALRDSGIGAGEVRRLAGFP